MLETLNNLTRKKVKLSVPLIACYIAKGYTQADISRLCNVSSSAVSDYIKRHYDELAPLVDSSDNFAAIKAKYVADKAQEKLLEHLPEATKKDLFALNAISGTHTDKYRLLSDKSTQNVSIEAIDTRIEDRDKRLIEVEARIKAKIGDLEMGNQESIEAESGEGGIR